MLKLAKKRRKGKKKRERRGKMANFRECKTRKHISRSNTKKGILSIWYSPGDQQRYIQ